MKIAVGCDHGGYVLKEAVLNAIRDSGMEAIDYGTFSEESVDYPQYAYAVARAVADGKADRGVLLCGTGIGVSIVANKVDGIRCGHVTDVFSAKATAEHNDANIIAMGGRISTPDAAYQMTLAYLATPFAGGRHQRRVDMITAVEQGKFTPETGGKTTC